LTKANAKKFGVNITKLASQDWRSLSGSHPVGGGSSLSLMEGLLSFVLRDQALASIQPGCWPFY
jgi:hypothetical protein